MEFELYAPGTTLLALLVSFGCDIDLDYFPGIFVIYAYVKMTYMNVVCLMKLVVGQLIRTSPPQPWITNKSEIMTHFLNTSYFEPHFGNINCEKISFNKVLF